MSSRQRGPLVYWEKQGAGRMCALHCLNSVLQGPYFTEAELSSIGMELDQKERQLMAEGGTHSEDYQAFIAEGSGNVAADGYFNISVLIECLRRKRILCICQKHAGEHEDEGIDFGFILNHSDHWLALRRVHGTWYNLDSMKAAPTPISNFHRNAFLSSLKDQGYTAFVVKPQVGDLPAPGGLQTRSNNQFYLTLSEIEELHRKAAEEEGQGAQRAGSSSSSNDTEVRSFLASRPRGQGQHVWPEGGGYRLTADAPSAAVSAAAVNEEEDPELQEAIRLSMECYKNEVAEPPPEPSASEEGVVRVFLRLPSGARLSRLFRQTTEMKQIFNWVVFESHNREGLPPLTPLSSFSLIQTFPRRRFCWLTGKMFLFVPDKEEGVDVAESSLSALEFQPQEQLMLQL